MRLLNVILGIGLVLVPLVFDGDKLNLAVTMGLQLALKTPLIDHWAVTRQTTLPTSSATSKAPRLSSTTPTGRP